MINFEKIKKEILQTLSSVFNAIGKNIDLSNINITFQDSGHDNPIFCEGKMYIYSFWFDKIENPLKIGKAGPKSKARYTHHHYNCNSSRSCLAKQILSDTNFIKNYNVDVSSGKKLNEWIHKNCKRINIEMPYDIDNEYDLFTLELIEAILHNMYAPLYEGNTQTQNV